MRPVIQRGNIAIKEWMESSVGPGFSLYLTLLVRNAMGSKGKKAIELRVYADAGRPGDRNLGPPSDDESVVWQMYLLIRHQYGTMADLTNESVRDASDVGVPCSICSSIDFLPFRCAHCRRAFCKEHSSAALPEEHDCPDYKSTIVSKSEQGKDGTATFKSLLPGKLVRRVIPQYMLWSH